MYCCNLNCCAGAGKACSGRLGCRGGAAGLSDIPNRQGRRQGCVEGRSIVHGHIEINQATARLGVARSLPLNVNHEGSDKYHAACHMPLGCAQCL